jgi:undecaprenyl-diphosphatase
LRDFFGATILRADDKSAVWLYDHSQHGLIGRFVVWLSEDSNPGMGILAAVLCFFWFNGSHNQQERRSTITTTVISGFLACLITRGLALFLPFRLRPILRTDLVFYPPPGSETAWRSWSSFPSDHATLSFALATGIWLISKRWGVLSFLVAIFAVCLPRLCNGLHYTSDVFVGAFLGISATLLARKLLSQKRLLPQLTGYEHNSPGMFYTIFFLIMWQTATMFESTISLVHGSLKLFHAR